MMMIRQLLRPNLIYPACSQNVQVRHGTRWPKGEMWDKGFEEPVKHQRDIREAKEDGTFKRKTLVPIKSAKSDANCSVFLEPETMVFIQQILRHGEKYVLMNQINETFRLIKDIQLKKYYKASENRRENIIVDPQEIVKKAIDNATPLLAIEDVKVGGVIYQVPAPIKEKSARFEAIRWIYQAMKDRDTRNVKLPPTLANILIETAHNQGRVIAVKNEHHKLCEQNRAYAHFRSSF